jgi:hypothetical protein
MFAGIGAWFAGIGIKAIAAGVAIAVLLGVAGIAIHKIEAGAVAQDRVEGYQKRLDEMDEKYKTLKKISDAQAAAAERDQQSMDKFDETAKGLIDALQKIPGGGTVCLNDDLARRLRNLK